MGLKLYVNDEQVWESEGDATLVSNISGSTARGEFGRLGVANDIDRVDLFISVRDPIESSTDLDIRERNFRNQNSEELEKRVANEGQAGDPANTLFNKTLEESRNPSSEDSSGDETTRTLDEATSATPDGESSINNTDSTVTNTPVTDTVDETPVNTSSSGGSSDTSGESVPTNEPFESTPKSSGLGGKGSVRIN